MSIEYDKRTAIIVALCAGKIPKQVIEFLKLQKSLPREKRVYQVKRNYDTAETQQKDLIRFLSEEKNFNLDQKLNRRTDRWT